MSRLTYVFVHGLNGSGEYDEHYRDEPYWGNKSGDVVAEWRSWGAEAHAASVSPQGSAWDRACELYAQLAGTRTDYGKAHSAEYRHERFGRDFSGQALIPSWDDGTRLVLICHSFGGVTARLFAELLAHGSAEERAATEGEGISPLFLGGMAERIFAIATLAAPTNGTTAYDMMLDPAFDARRVRVPLRYKLLNLLVKRATTIRTDGRDRRDWADHDMMVDNAQVLNARIGMLPHAYYLSVACDATMPGADGARVPDRAVMDPLLVRTATLMGRYSGVTLGGCRIDDAWHAGDGMVNTLSARAPFGAPQKPLDRSCIERGVWNVMGDLHADHAFFQGGFMRVSDPHAFFRDLYELLQSLG